MTKREFLDTLQMQLQGELSQTQIEGHLHYYREYIAEAVASGRSEREVLEELGSPQLIARTILDAARGAARSQDGYRGQYDDGSGEYRGQYDDGFDGYRGQYDDGFDGYRGQYDDGSDGYRGQYNGGFDGYRGQENDVQDAEDGGRKVHTWYVSPTVVKWVLPICLILILLLILSVVGSVAMLAVRYFIPILLIILLIRLWRRG